MNKIKTPFLGCAYYPEDWPDEQLGEDIAKMREAGIRCARVGEFAWRRMEPRPGEFDFAWLHRVIDALGEAGIAVVLGTPTATPPVWLPKAHPEVLRLDEDDRRVNHGGRRHCCSNSPEYIAASARIVEAMGREFGSDPNVIGWQLDNEIYAHGLGCFCGFCMKAFRDRLRREYGTVGELNRRWDLNLFSQAYDDFDDVPPARKAWHNPHISFEWMMSQHESHARFLRMQADILRRFTSAPVGTDMMPLPAFDQDEVTSFLDVAQFNHYNEPCNLARVPFWMDRQRTLKDRPFWNTETATNWNGSTNIGQFIKPEGYCRVNSWLPVALGGECNMYWLWRQHWAGHELLHGSVLTPEGRPVHVFGEVRRTAAEFEKASEFVSGTKVESDVALHFSARVASLFEQQPVFWSNRYDDYVATAHRAVSGIGARPDVIGSTKPLDKYKALFSPMMMTLEEGDLAARIRAWVEAGGVWVAGPITDVRNSIGAHYLDQATGMLEKWLGVRLDHAIPSDCTVLKLEWCDRHAEIEKPAEINGHSRNWLEVWADSPKIEPIVKIAEGNSALNGRTVVGRVRVGRGEVILCGWTPTAGELARIAGMALADAGARRFETTGELVVAPRRGEAGEGVIVCEIADKPATVRLPEPMTDLLTGLRHEGVVNVAPYDVMVFKR